MPTPALVNLVRTLKLASASLAQAEHELRQLNLPKVADVTHQWQQQTADLLASAIGDTLTDDPPRGIKQPATPRPPRQPAQPAAAVQPTTPRTPAAPPPAKIV